MRHLLLLLLCACAHLVHAETVQYSDAKAHPFTADYWPGERGAVLLLHQCNGDRGNYAKLGAALAASGLSVLAPDSRGYGGSVGDGTDLPKAFREAKDSNAAMAEYARIKALWPTDVKLHAAQLRERSGTTRIAVIGASCGGDLALQLALNDSDVTAVVTLSARIFDETRDALAKLARTPVWFIATESDGQFPGEATTSFAKSANRQSRLTIYKGEAHGTPLFEQEPVLMQQIADWLLRESSATMSK